jgi:hypothetical protein
MTIQVSEIGGAYLAIITFPCAASISYNGRGSTERFAIIQALNAMDAANKN